MQLGTIRYSARAAICVAALSLVACPSKDQPPPQPPPEPEPEVVEEVEEEEGPPAYAEAKWWDDFFTEFNAGEFDKVAIRFTPAPAARSVGMPVPEQPSREGLVAGWQQARAMLPDNRMTAQRVLLDGNVAYAHVVTTGTHTGDVEGLSASGKSVGWTSLFRFEFDDEGLASKMTIYANPMAFAAQAGLVRGKKIPVPDAPEFETTPLVVDPGPASRGGIVKAWYASYTEGWSSAKSALPETFADEAIFHLTYVGSTGEGLDWAKSHFSTELKSTSEHEHSDLEVHAIGDYVAVTGTLTAIQTKRVPGVGGRGKTWTSDFAEIYRFEGDKVVELWIYRNPEQVLDQLRG